MTSLFSPRRRAAAAPRRPQARDARAATAAPETLETRALLAAASLPPEVSVAEGGALDLDAGLTQAEVDAGATAEWRVFNLDGRYADTDADGDRVPREIARTGPTATVSHAELIAEYGEYADGAPAGRIAPGPLRVELTVTAADGAVTRDTAEIQVVDVPPTLEEAVGDRAVDEGTAVSLTLDVVDPYDAETLDATFRPVAGSSSTNPLANPSRPDGQGLVVVDWGDGEVDQFLARDVFPGAERGTFVVDDWRQTVSHVYADGAAGGTEYEVNVYFHEDEYFGVPNDLPYGNVLLGSGTVTVNNVAPAPDAFIATFPRVEGGEIEFLGGASDVSADTLSYAWTVADASGNVVHTSNEQDTSFVPADDGTYTLTLTVTDDDGGVGTELTDFTVDNVAPTVDAFAGPGAALRGRTVTFTGAVSDPGAADVLTATLHWGDGTTSAVTANPDGSFAADHVYADLGDYTVTLTVDDGDGGTDTVTAEIAVGVAAVLDDGLYGGSALFVAGTAGDDVLTVRRDGDDLVVREAGAVVGTFAAADFGRVVIDGFGGDDFLSVSTSVAKAAWISGGAGNDYLRGGSGADVIDGGAGHDLLAGRGGRDVLIGGAGADWVFGNAQQDILIAGTVDLTAATSGGAAGFASNADGLKFVADAWNGAGGLFDRFAQLAPVLEGGETVLDDGSTDLLVGGRGVDWFFGENGRDVIFDDPFRSIFDDDLDWILDWT